MSEHLTISATEFKAKCLDIFTRLADRRLSGVTVTRRGKPVAEVEAAAATRNHRVRAVHGSMAGSVVMNEEFDLTAPIFEGEIHAEHGILHK